MTLIQIELLQSDGVSPIAGAVTFYPTRRRIVDDAVSLPTNRTVQLDEDGQASIELDPTTPDFVWSSKERFLGGLSYLEEHRYFLVPDSPTPLDYADLVDVDPTLYEPVDTVTSVSDALAVMQAEIVAVPDAVAVAMGNPETALNNETVEIVEATLNTGTPNLLKTVDARSDLSTARPAWNGTIVWLINEGDANPPGLVSGDMAWEVEAEPLPFSPSMVPNLRGWFDAQTFSVDGASVSSWTNLAVDGVAATQATGGNQPIVDIDKINGHPAVIADGSNDRLTFPIPPYTGPMTVYAVCGSDLADVVTSSDFLFDAADVSATAQRFALYRNASEAIVVQRASQTRTGAASSWPTGHHLIRVIVNGAASTVTMDGTQVIADTLSTSLEIVSYSIFSRADAANFFAGYLGELIIVHGTVSVDDDADIITYLEDRWGL